MHMNCTVIYEKQTDDMRAAIIQLEGFCRERLLWLRLECGLLGGRGSWGRNSGGFALLGCWLDNNLVDGGLHDLDGIGERLAGAGLALGVPSLHTNFTVNNKAGDPVRCKLTS